MTKIAEILPDGPEKEAMVKQFGPDGEVATLVKSFMDTKSKLSSTARVPGQNATPEEWNEFYGKLGRPNDPSGYDLPAEAPGSIKAILEALRPVAHANGISREAFSKLAAEASSKAAASEREMAAQRTEWERRFRDANGDRSDVLLAQAKETLDKLTASDPKMKEVLDKTGLSAHTAMLDAILKVRQAVSDDKAPFGGTGPAPGPSGEKLYETAMQIMQTPEFKQTNHPMHEITSRRIRQIQADLYRLGFSGLTDPKLHERGSLTLPDGTVIR
jgi:hypothetical protein